MGRGASPSSVSFYFSRGGPKAGFCRATPLYGYALYFGTRLWYNCQVGRSRRERERQSRAVDRPEKYKKEVRHEVEKIPRATGGI